MLNFNNKDTIKRKSFWIGINFDNIVKDFYKNDFDLFLKTNNLNNDLFNKKFNPNDCAIVFTQIETDLFFDDRNMHFSSSILFDYAFDLTLDSSLSPLLSIRKDTEYEDSGYNIISENILKLKNKKNNSFFYLLLYLKDNNKTFIVKQAIPDDLFLKQDMISYDLEKDDSWSYNSSNTEYYFKYFNLSIINI